MITQCFNHQFGAAVTLNSGKPRLPWVPGEGPATSRCMLSRTSARGPQVSPAAPQSRRGGEPRAARASGTRACAARPAAGRGDVGGAPGAGGRRAEEGRREGLRAGEEAGRGSGKGEEREDAGGPSGRRGGQRRGARPGSSVSVARDPRDRSPSRRRRGLRPGLRPRWDSRARRPEPAAPRPSALA